MLDDSSPRKPAVSLWTPGNSSAMMSIRKMHPNTVEAFQSLYDCCIELKRMSNMSAKRTRLHVG